MNHQNLDSENKKEKLAQAIPPKKSIPDVTGDGLESAQTRLETDGKVLNQKLGWQNYELRKILGAVAAIAPLIILAFAGSVIWFDPEKIKSIGIFAGSAFVAAPLLAFLAIYGLLIQSIFNDQREPMEKIHSDTKGSGRSISSMSDSDEHERSIEIQFENFVRDEADNADKAKYYAHKDLPYISRIRKMAVYDINSVATLKKIKIDLLYGELADQSQPANRRAIAALEHFIQFRQHEQNERKRHGLNRMIQNQQVRKQTYNLRWILGGTAVISPIIIVSFLGAIVWCKPDTFDKMGSYAGAAFVSTTLLAFVVVYGFLIRGIFNVRKQDDKYTVAELWDLIKRNTSIALND